MTAKQYLSQASSIRRRMKEASDHVQEIRETMASVKAIKYDKLHVQTSPDGDPLIREMIRLEQASERFVQQAADYYAIYNEIEKQIDEMPDALFRQVLRLRYLEEMPLHQIAAMLAYSDKYILNIHGKALQDFGQRFLGI